MVIGPEGNAPFHPLPLCPHPLTTVASDLLAGTPYAELLPGSAELPRVLWRLGLLGSRPRDGRGLLAGPFPGDEALDLYFGEHGLSAADRRWLRERAVGHPIATFGQPLAVRSAAAAALPRTHVRCSADPGPPAVLPGQEGWGTPSCARAWAGCAEEGERFATRPAEVSECPGEGRRGRAVALGARRLRGRGWSRPGCRRSRS